MNRLVAICKGCKEKYDAAKLPFVLKCGHSLCLTCIRILFKKGGQLLICPFDRIPCSNRLEEIPINYALAEVLGLQYEASASHPERTVIFNERRIPINPNYPPCHIQYDVSEARSVVPSYANEYIPHAPRYENAVIPSHPAHNINMTSFFSDSVDSNDTIHNIESRPVKIGSAYNEPSAMIHGYRPDNVSHDIRHNDLHPNIGSFKAIEPMANRTIPNPDILGSARSYKIENSSTPVLPIKEVKAVPKLKTKYSVMNMMNGKVHFFVESAYVRFDNTYKVVDTGYPKTIAEGWRMQWSYGFDTCFIANQYWIYYFKGPEYIKYSILLDISDWGYPKTIEEGWPGLPFDSIDAAVKYTNGKIYFFKGDMYCSFDFESDTIDPGYPRLIATDWPGVWADKIDSISVDPSDATKLLIFRGNEYIQYNYLKRQIEPGYPRSVSESFKGIPPLQK